MYIYWNTTKGTLRYVNLQLLVWTCKWGREGGRRGKEDLVNELHTHWDGEGQLLPLSMEFSRRAEFSPCTFSLNNKEIIEEYGLITHRKQLCCAPRPHIQGLFGHWVVFCRDGLRNHRWLMTQESGMGKNAAFNVFIPLFFQVGKGK